MVPRHHSALLLRCTAALYCCTPIDPLSCFSLLLRSTNPIDYSALLFSSTSPLRKDLPALARELRWWELFLIAALFLLSSTFETIAAVHARLEQSSKEYVIDTGMFDYMSLGDWHLLARAGVASRRSRQRLEAESQPLAGSLQHLHTAACFFADIGILSRTLVVPMGPGPWRDHLA